ncbi:MAG: polysaccharide deacetylase family protein [Capsulimonadaceae bacterium]|nr:polysaccharide deacetylase family protein [Capsulimonadaceae bacterium]
MGTRCMAGGSLMAAALILALPVGAKAAELRDTNPIKTNSIGLVAPTASVSASWESPNRLTVAATIEKLKGEDGPAWLAALGMPSNNVLKRVALDQDRLDRSLARSIVFRGNTQHKTIALTFDDGPHPVYTQRLLLTLHDLGVPATFFVVGKQVEKYPELARAIDAMGYPIGNHTYDHCSLLKIPGNYVPTEILACGYAVKAAIGTTPHLFRPPGGEFDKLVAQEAVEMGYRTVLWTDDPGDFAKPSADIIVKRVLSHASSGGIILLHDGIEETLEALPRIVDDLRQDGYEFVSVDDLIRQHDADVRAAATAEPVPQLATKTRQSR